jgi:hypothetical protein
MSGNFESLMWGDNPHSECLRFNLGFPSQPYLYCVEVENQIPIPVVLGKVPPKAK